MPVVKLTKKAVDNAITSGAPLYLWDDDVKGFGLKVTAIQPKAPVVWAKAAKTPLGRLSEKINGAPCYL